METLRCLNGRGWQLTVFSFLLVALMSAGAWAQPLLGEPQLISKEEVISQRNQTTRVYNHHYEQDVLDASGNPTGEVHQFTRKLVEKADGLCYDAQDYEANPKGAPLWELTEVDFIAASEAGMSYKVTNANPKLAFGTALVDDYHIQYKISDREKDYTLKLGVCGIGYYDSSTGQLLLLESAKGVIPAANGNEILYSDAFSIGDLQYINARGYFKQNLIISDISSLPEPQTLGLNPGTTFLVIVSRLDLANFGLDAFVSVNTGPEITLTNSAEGVGLRLSFKDSDGKELCYFSPDTEATDSLESPRSIAPIYKKIIKNPDGSGRLVEGVAWSWLKAKERQLPVTLDFMIRSGTSQGSETWHEGVTYHVSSNFAIPSNHTLAIEGGAVVKINDNALITIADGACLKAQGKMFNYVIITSGNDTSVGESVGGTGPGDGIRFPPSLSSLTAKSLVRYCKFTNQTCGLCFSNVSLAPQGNMPSISHSIFRECSGAIHITFDIQCQTDVNMEVFNCLFARSSYQSGSYAMDIAAEENAYLLTLKFYNCTLHNLNYGITYYGSDDMNLTIKDNLFTNPAAEHYGIYGPGSYPSGEYDYNAFYHATNNTNLSNGGHNILLSVNPYEISPNGSYYTTYILYDSGELWEDYNAWSGQEAVMKAKTVKKPKEYSGSIDSAVNIPGDDQFEDDGSRVAIGYHYDIVNAVISGITSFTNNVTLTIPAGAVVSYEGTSSELQVENQRLLSATGTASEPILFTCIDSTSDEIALPSQANNALKLMNSGSCYSTIAYCIFKYLNCGIYVEELNLANPISNCVFASNNSGVFFDNLINYDVANTKVDVMNCLLIQNGVGITHRYLDYTNSDLLSFLNVEGNTFSANTQALRFDSNTYDITATIDTVIEDNIFANNDIAVILQKTVSSNITINDVTRNNLFWNNDTVVQGSAIDTSDSSNISENPLFVHHSSSANSDWISEYETGVWGIWPDGYFLAQEDGDASRRPFYFYQNQILKAANPDGIQFIGGENPFTQGMILYVGCSEDFAPLIYSWNPADWRGRLNASGYTQGSQTSAGYLWVMVQNEGYGGGKEKGGGGGGLLPIPSNCAIKLNFHHSGSSEISSLVFYLPPIVIPDGGGYALFYLTEDGSLYYARAYNPSNPPFHNLLGPPEFDSWYAIRWVEQEPATSAYDYRLTHFGNVESARSPAIDGGSIDFLNDGWTNTAVTKETRDNRGHNPTTYEAEPNVPDRQISPEVQDPDVEDYDHLTNTRLDLGYHYYGTGLRHPFERIYDIMDITYMYLGELVNTNPEVRPQIEGARSFEVAASTSPGNQEETVTVYRSGHFYPDPYPGSHPDGPFPHIALLYNFYRQTGTGSRGIVKLFTEIYEDGNPFSPYIDSVAALAIPGLNNLYCACTVYWEYNETPGLTYNDVRVYRYVRGAPGYWVLIANYFRVREQTPGPIPSQVRLTGCHRGGNDHLWVFWKDAEHDQPGPIIGDYIANAQSIGTPVTLTPPSGFSVVDIDSTEDIQFEVTFDDRTNDSIANPLFQPGVARIVYHTISGNNELIKAARVRLQPTGGNRGDPVGRRDEHTLSFTDNVVKGYPAIAYNRTSLFGNPDDVNMAVYLNITDETHHSGDGKASFMQEISGTDVWTVPPGIQIPIRWYGHPIAATDVTYRAFGSARYALTGYLPTVYTLGTNTECLLHPLYNDVIARITTNQVNSTDPYVVSGESCPQSEWYLDAWMIDP